MSLLGNVYRVSDCLMNIKQEHCEGFAIKSEKSTMVSIRILVFVILCFIQACILISQ